MNQWSDHLTIIEDDEVTHFLTTSKNTYPRIDEIWEGISWKLANKSNDLFATSTVIKDKKYYIFNCEIVIQNYPASITGLFTADDNQVNVLKLAFNSAAQISIVCEEKIEEPA